MAGRRVTLIEDVITTGGAVRDATRPCASCGAVVEVVVCAIDRSPEGENPLADVGLEIRAVLTRAELDAVAARRRTTPSVEVAAGDVAVRSAVVRADLGAGGVVRLCRHHSMRSGSARRPG